MYVGVCIKMLLCGRRGSKRGTSNSDSAMELPSKSWVLAYYGYALYRFIWHMYPPGSYSGEMLNVAKNEKFAKSLVSKGTWKSKTTFTESQNVQGLKVHLEVQRPCSSRATQSRHLCNLLLSNKD